MIRYVFLFLLAALVSFQSAISQDTIPLLKGKVTLSITKGTIECDFTLSDIPAIEDYVIRLNSGMNIFYFKDLDYNNLITYEWSFTDTMSTGETKAYYFPAGSDRKSKFLPKRIQFRRPIIFQQVATGKVSFYQSVSSFVI